MTPVKNVFINQQTVAVAATDGRFLGSNSRRRGLIISCPPTGTVFVSFNGAAVANGGLALYAGGPAVVLDQQMLGNSITEEIRCIGSLGGQTVGVIELSDG